MPNELMVLHCAPTLAGLKTGSLFACQVASVEELQKGIRAWNRQLSGKGLLVLPLRFADGRALIYVYRPCQLARDLENSAACSLLEACGYPSGNVSRRVACLAQRLRRQAAFPHEIGLFLGYPAEDVRGFMERRPCKCVGCWKVYGDAEAAQRTFAAYHRCTRDYLDKWRHGVPIEQLTVTV